MMEPVLIVVFVCGVVTGILALAALLYLDGRP